MLKSTFPEDGACEHAYVVNASLDAQDAVEAVIAAVTVKLPELSPVGNENRFWITPFPFPAGVPLVATTVPGFVPAVESTSVLVTVRVPWTWSATDVVLPPYVIVVPVVPVTELNTFAALVAGPVVPVIVLPFGLVSTRIPKYTCVCALVFTPVQVHTAPPLPAVAVPLTVQLPPPGRL